MATSFCSLYYTFIIIIKTVWKRSYFTNIDKNQHKGINCSSTCLYNYNYFYFTESLHGKMTIPCVNVVNHPKELKYIIFRTNRTTHKRFHHWQRCLEPHPDCIRDHFTPTCINFIHCVSNRMSDVPANGPFKHLVVAQIHNFSHVTFILFIIKLSIIFAFSSVLI